MRNFSVCVHIYIYVYTHIHTYIIFFLKTGSYDYPQSPSVTRCNTAHSLGTTLAGRGSRCTRDSSLLKHEHCRPVRRGVHPSALLGCPPDLVLSWWKAVLWGWLVLAGPGQSSQFVSFQLCLVLVALEIFPDWKSRAWTFLPRAPYFQGVA